MNFEIAELDRKLNNLLRIGTIKVADHERQQIKVESGGLTTGWLDWPAEIGRNYRRWRPLRVGTQVLIACPSGDPAQALVIGMLYTQAIDTPSENPEIDLIEFNGGSYLKHNATDNSIHIHAAAEMTLSYSHLYMQGPVTQTGGDMTSDGISAQHHTHGGVQAGGSNTAEPNA